MGDPQLESLMVLLLLIGILMMIVMMWDATSG
jgi:hypothetical protein